MINRQLENLWDIHGHSVCESIWQLSLAFSQATLPVLFAQLAFAHRPKILTVEFTFEAVDILYHIHAVCNIQISKNAYFVKQRIPSQKVRSSKYKLRIRRKVDSESEGWRLEMRSPCLSQSKKHEKGGQIIIFWKVAQ